jgi:putative ABC transport system ATP-binding protein
MASLALRGREDSAAFIENFNGRERFILDYLFDEVFSQQSTAIQSFLLQTAVLEYLSGPLCDHVYMPDDQPAVFPNSQAILDNILLPSMRDASRNKAAITEKARALMQEAGIAELETRSITQASGGQLQRVGICRALMGSPAIIFGDEPTGALNSKSANEILNLLLEIQRKGTTILLVTHAPKVAAKSERVLFMLDGKIIGEYHAGPYDEAKGELKAREEKLSAWLVDMKF